MSCSSWPTLTMLFRFSELYARIGRSSSSIGMSSMFGGSCGTPATARSGAAAWTPIVTNGWNWRTRMSAERESASSGVIVPSVSISSVSLSKLVIWPTRVLSTQ